MLNRAFLGVPAMCLQISAPKPILALLVAFWMAGCAPTLYNKSEGGFSEQKASHEVAASQAIGPGSDGRVSQAAAALTSETTPGTASYKIGPLDKLQISVFQAPELTQTVQVTDLGTINLPLVGEIPVSGKTVKEVERDLTLRLGASYLQKPQVNVLVAEFNSQRVTISGAIKKPGVYPLTGNTTLLQFVASAGGFDDKSDWTVLVLRQSGGKRMAGKFDVNQIEKGRAEDPIIQSGDYIIAGSSLLKGTYGVLMKALGITGRFALI